MKKTVNHEENYEGGGLIRSFGGKEKVMNRRLDEKEMYDERILGSGDFVESVLDIESEKTKKVEKIQTIEKLLLMVCNYYKIDEELLLRTKKKESREARTIFIYLALEYLNKRGVELQKLLKITSGSVGIAKEKGRKICKENQEIVDFILG